MKGLILDSAELSVIYERVPAPDGGGENGPPRQPPGEGR